MRPGTKGLQVKRKDGKWIPITVLAEQIVVNVGDITTGSGQPFTG